MSITPASRHHCQVDVPTGGPFQLGGSPGDPKNGYRRPCGNKPAYIVKEKEPGPDGLRGEMSICSSCWLVFLEEFNLELFEVIDIEREPEERSEN